MGKKKTRKKREKTSAKIRANAKTIAVVVLLFIVSSGTFFYLGRASPQLVIWRDFDLVGQPISDITYVTLAPPYTGVKISIHVTYASDYWVLLVKDMADNTVYTYGQFHLGNHTTPFISVPGGCKILLEAASGDPWYDLEGQLAVVASGPPFNF